MHINNNLICVAPLKTEFTKCFDRQSKSRLLRRQYDNRKRNKKAKQKQDKIMVKIR